MSLRSYISVLNWDCMFFRCLRNKNEEIVEKKWKLLDIFPKRDLRRSFPKTLHRKRDVEYDFILVSFFQNNNKNKIRKRYQTPRFLYKIKHRKVISPFSLLLHSPYIWFPCHNFSICFSSTIKKKLYSHCVFIFLNQLNYLYTLIACNNYHSKWSK